VGASLFGGVSASQIPVGQILMLVGLFCLFFGAGIYVAAALGLLGIIAGFAFSERPFWTFIGQMVWGPTTNFVLVAVPLFLLMGEIMLRAGLSDRLYRSLNLWLQRVPGGLLHTNIAASSVFSAISGSSVATAATMGSVALPYFRDTRYSQPMVMGSGLNYNPILVDPNDSQFLDSMRFAVEEACRFWRVPPSMVYGSSSGQNITYSNVTQSDLSYLKHSLEGHLVRIEKARGRVIAIGPSLQRLEIDAPEVDLGPLGLDEDPALGEAGAGALVHDLPVDDVGDAIAVGDHLAAR
jgi:hypothetical protein